MSVKALRAMLRWDPVSAVIIAMAALTLFYFTFSRHRITTNPLSRIITVERLVEKGTFAWKTPSDSTRFNLSLDHVKVGENFYSSKPPTYPLLMAAQGKALRVITGLNFFDHQRSYVRMLVLLNQVLPYVVMLLLALALMQTLALDRFTTRFMLLALSFGLLPFGYAVVINNHTLSATLLFIAFWLFYRRWYRNKGNIISAIVAGFLAGFSTANDLPTGLFSLSLLALWTWKSPREGAGAWVAAAVPVLLSSWIYYSITGSWKPFYLQGGLYRYEGAYWTHPEGPDAQQDPFGIYFLNAIVGHHGLFSITPVLLLAFGALPLWLLKKEFPWKTGFALIHIFTLSVIAFVLLRTSNYGGYCIGLRWYISFMPLLMFTAWPLVAQLSKSVKGKIVLWALLILSLPWNFEALYWEGFIQSSFETWWVQHVGL